MPGAGTRRGSQPLPSLSPGLRGAPGCICSALPRPPPFPPPPSKLRTCLRLISKPFLYLIFFQRRSNIFQMRQNRDGSKAFLCGCLRLRAPRLSSWLRRVLPGSRSPPAHAHPSTSGLQCSAPFPVRAARPPTGLLAPGRLVLGLFPLSLHSPCLSAASKSLVPCKLCDPRLALGPGLQDRKRSDLPGTQGPRRPPSPIHTPHSPSLLDPSRLGPADPRPLAPALPGPRCRRRPRYRHRCRLRAPRLGLEF